MGNAPFDPNINKHNLRNPLVNNVSNSLERVPDGYQASTVLTAQDAKSMDDIGYRHKFATIKANNDVNLNLLIEQGSYFIDGEIISTSVPRARYVTKSTLHNKFTYKVTNPLEEVPATADTPVGCRVECVIEQEFTIINPYHTQSSSFIRTGTGNFTTYQHTLNVSGCSVEQVNGTYQLDTDIYNTSDTTPKKREWFNVLNKNIRISPVHITSGNVTFDGWEIKHTGTGVVFATTTKPTTAPYSRNPWEYLSNTASGTVDSSVSWWSDNNIVVTRATLQLNLESLFEDHKFIGSDLSIRWDSWKEIKGVSKISNPDLNNLLTEGTYLISFNKTCTYADHHYPIYLKDIIAMTRDTKLDNTDFYAYVDVEVIYPYSLGEIAVCVQTFTPLQPMIGSNETYYHNPNSDKAVGGPARDNIYKRYITYKHSSNVITDETLSYVAGDWLPICNFGRRYYVSYISTEPLVKNDTLNNMEYCADFDSICFPGTFLFNSNTVGYWIDNGVYKYYHVYPIKHCPMYGNGIIRVETVVENGGNIVVMQYLDFHTGQSFRRTGVLRTDMTIRFANWIYVGVHNTLGSNANVVFGGTKSIAEIMNADWNYENNSVELFKNISFKHDDPEDSGNITTDGQVPWYLYKTPVVDRISRIDHASLPVDDSDGGGPLHTGDRVEYCDQFGARIITTYITDTTSSTLTDLGKNYYTLTTSLRCIFFAPNVNSGIIFELVPQTDINGKVTYKKVTPTESSFRPMDYVGKRISVFSDDTIVWLPNPKWFKTWWDTPINYNPIEVGYISIEVECHKGVTEAYVGSIGDTFQDCSLIKISNLFKKTVENDVNVETSIGSCIYRFELTPVAGDANSGKYEWQLVVDNNDIDDVAKIVSEHVSNVSDPHKFIEGYVKTNIPKKPIPDQNEDRLVPSVSAVRSAMNLAVPAGTVLTFAGAIVPEGYLLCDGKAYSNTEYPALKAAIGYTYGGSDSSGTFNVPDFRSAYLRGYRAENDPMSTHTKKATSGLGVLQPASLPDIQASFPGIDGGQNLHFGGIGAAIQSGSSWGGFKTDGGRANRSWFIFKASAYNPYGKAPGFKQYDRETPQSERDKQWHPVYNRTNIDQVLPESYAVNYIIKY